MEEPRQIIFGPPGTGKTTELIRLVEECLHDGYSIESIAYLAFTKKAALEALTRVEKALGSPLQDMYFRTIHSLAFRECNLSANSVMRQRDFKELGDMLGIEVSGYINMEEGTLSASNLGDRLFFLINLARVKGIPLVQVWEEANDDLIDWNELERVDRSYARFKIDRGLYDFTDMLIMFRDSSKLQSLGIKVLIVDEAQDLSPIQWDIIDQIIPSAERVYIAGDDDQAIYRWAGADKDYLIDCKRQQQGFRIRTLDQSYRIPRHVHMLSEEIIHKINDRQLKEFKARDNDGYLSYESDFDHIDMSEGTWLLLARNGYMLKDFKDYCHANGWPFESRGDDTVKNNIMSAILGWTRGCQNKPVFYHDLLNIHRYVSKNNGNHVTTMDLEKIKRKKSIMMKELRQLGMRAEGIWHEALDLIPYEMREFYIAALRRGENLTHPRIKISTIHGVKGGEADNVVVLTDLSYKVYQQYCDSRDDECRVFYVAVTRAKKSLYIIAPKTNMYFEV